jgi:hypothetical protein
MGIEAFEAPQSRYGGRWCALEIDGPPPVGLGPLPRGWRLPYLTPFNL